MGQRTKSIALRIFADKSLYQEQVVIDAINKLKESEKVCLLLWKDGLSMVEIAKYNIGSKKQVISQARVSQILRYAAHRMMLQRVFSKPFRDLLINKKYLVCIEPVKEGDLPSYEINLQHDLLIT